LATNVERALKQAPIVAILGPRQCGKTTLAHAIAARHSRATLLDLENPVDRARLETAFTEIAALRGLVVIDEIQRQPELFELLRVFADRRPLPARFLILGSASPSLVRGVSESLAGRVAFVHIDGFNLAEVGESAMRKLWSRGGFPRSFLAKGDAASLAWRNDFIQTFLERDIPQLGITVPAVTLRRFWLMLAHYHGQVWNAAEFARSLGTSEPTARRYLDILTGAFVVRQLPPWFENLGKRQVKAPKVFLRDAGILHAFLGLPTLGALAGHPKLGASWEGFVLNQVVAMSGDQHPHFWATHSGAELDILLQPRGRRVGIEVKYADAPRLTRSMNVVLADLRLDELLVVYPGDTAYRLAPRVRVVPLGALRSALGVNAGE
jgi:predicted AAA+ superfamily ATPase